MLKKSIPAITANLYGKQERLDEAHLALGRPDSITALLPERSVFLDGYVRKEAVMSWQIEGTKSSLPDLTLFGRPVTTIAVICATTGQSPHTVNTMLDAMIGQGRVREVTRMRRNRIYEYSAYLEILNREGEP